MPTEYLNVSLIAGNGDRPSRDFALAVHMTLRWAQDRGSGPICATLPLSEELEATIRSGLPIAGEGSWPPSDTDLDLSRIPSDVPPTAVNARRAVTWRLTPEHLDLTLETAMKGSTHRVAVEIAAGHDVRLRVRLWQGTGRFVPSPPRILRMISSACDGLFDEGWQILPEPMPVDSEEAAVELVELLQAEERKLPTVVFCAPTRNGSAAERVAKKFSFDVFPFAHVALVSGAGFRHLCDMLPAHPPASGRMRIYGPGYSEYDLPNRHRTARIFDAQGGDISLGRWRASLMLGVALAAEVEELE